MKLILLCLVVAIVFAKPKGSIELAKDVAQKETDKAVEEARNVCQSDCREKYGTDAFRELFSCYYCCKADCH